jgi:hypothetical protein
MAKDAFRTQDQDKNQGAEDDNILVCITMWQKTCGEGFKQSDDQRPDQSTIDISESSDNGSNESFNCEHHPHVELYDAVIGAVQDAGKAGECASEQERPRKRALDRHAKRAGGFAVVDNAAY